jgi:hypothetical protein
MKAPWSCGIAFWAFCTRLICGTVRRLFHIGEGSLGRIGNTAPSISDVIPMGSKRFALQGIEYAFLFFLHSRCSGKASSQSEARDPRPKTRVVQRASPLSGPWAAAAW